MKVKNCTIQQLEQALVAVNEDYGYRLGFNREPEFKGKQLHFTIQSKKSGIPGARMSATGRNMKSASWHAHGYLFERILSIAPNAVIQTAHSKIYIDKVSGEFIGNWIDSDIGSMMSPCWFSATSIL